MIRTFRLYSCCIVFLLLAGYFYSCKNPAQKSTEQVAQTQRPNILFVISDDQSYPHTSAYGYKAVSTPAFDRVAREGILLTNAFVASPGCSPSRAALLSGLNCWQTREAGTHASTFPADLPIYTEVLEKAGYHVGLTGKGWGPGKVVGRPHNPAGKGLRKAQAIRPQGHQRQRLCRQLCRLPGPEGRWPALLLLVWSPGTAPPLPYRHWCQKRYESSRREGTRLPAR